jgi:hypothetical protein
VEEHHRLAVTALEPPEFRTYGLRVMMHGHTSFGGWHFGFALRFSFFLPIEPRLHGIHDARRV